MTAARLLPNVRATLDHLRRAGCSIRIVTNQGGVAFGHNREADVVAKLRRVAAALGYDGIGIHDGGAARDHDSGATAGTLPIHVCYADTRSPNPRYNNRRAAARHKPSGAMITEALVGFDRRRALYVGDRPEDQAAAQNAGVAFQWAADFFGRMTWWPRSVAYRQSMRM